MSVTNPTATAATLDLVAYIARSAVTATFPVAHALTYPALGLCGEAGELTYDVMLGSVHDDMIAAELGDVCWYAAALTRNVGLDIDELVERVTHDRMPALTPKRGMLVRAIQSSAAVVAEQVKKAVREGETDLPSDRKAVVRDEIGTVLLAGRDLAGLLDGWTFERVLAANIAKLEDRVARGVLFGDGSSR